MNEECNLTSQVDEIEALSAIYGNDWVVDCATSRRFIVNIAKNIRLNIRFADEYPSSGPPYFELDAVELSGEQRSDITAMLNELYIEHIGEPIVYTWVEGIREYLSNLPSSQKDNAQRYEDDETSDEKLMLNKPTDETDSLCPEIFHDEPIIDRKSTFQAHVAQVENIAEVKAVMHELLSNKKIAAATHNIQAYRIKLENGAIAEDCDDDGETHAASRVLHLLNIVDAVNVVVVVSRWYGGIQLGPDRFKHINNCARNILEKHNFISQHDKKQTSKKNNSKS